MVGPHWFWSHCLLKLALGSDFAMLLKFCLRDQHQNLSAMSQIGLQLPIAQFDILFRINGVDMKWLGNIGLGDIAFRSWLFVQIFPCFPNFATEIGTKICLP